MALYKEIADKIMDKINSGIYKPGEKIPSIRQMASEFGCNKLTVQKAFDTLKQKGYLENMVGSGSFVKFPEKISRTGDIFDFKTSYISESFFPYEKARDIFTNLFDSEKTHAFSPPPVEGDPEFLNVLGRYYQVPIKQMFVISGAQQGLDIISKVFLTHISDNILFEDPTYSGAISLFKARNFVPLESDGPDIKLLDKNLSAQIKLFYAMPAVHNPTGISYSLEKKEKIAQLSKKHHFYIIEDDYLSEFNENNLPRFVDICPEKTIYIKSLSQTTVSGIRLGFMIVPESLYDKFLYTKYSSDIASTGLLQKFAKMFIIQGYYEEYIKKIRKTTNNRKKRLIQLIKNYPGLSVSLPQSGYSLWIKSKKPVTLASVPWTRGENFSFSPEFKNYFRLSFMHMNDKTFEKGIIYLKEIFGRI